MWFHFKEMQRIFSRNQNAFKCRQNSTESFIAVFKEIKSHNIAHISIKWIAKLKQIHELLIFCWPNSYLFFVFLSTQIVNCINVTLILLSELFYFSQDRQIFQIREKRALQNALFTFRKTVLSNRSKYCSWKFAQIQNFLY